MVVVLVEVVVVVVGVVQEDSRLRIMNEFVRCRKPYTGDGKYVISQSLVL